MKQIERLNTDKLVSTTLTQINGLFIMNNLSNHPRLFALHWKTLQIRGLLLLGLFLTIVGVSEDAFGHSAKASF